MLLRLLFYFLFICLFVSFFCSFLRIKYSSSWKVLPRSSTLYDTIYLYCFWKKVNNDKFNVFNISLICCILFSTFICCILFSTSFRPDSSLLFKFKFLLSSLVYQCKELLVIEKHKKIFSLKTWTKYVT